MGKSNRPQPARRFCSTAPRTFRYGVTTLSADSLRLWERSRLPLNWTSASSEFFRTRHGPTSLTARCIILPFRNIAIAMNEPLGNRWALSVLRKRRCWVSFSLVLPALAMGNTVVAVPSEAYPLITGDLYQLFDTSDLPGGVVNIVTGYASQLLKVLAEHDDVDAVWSFGNEAAASAAKAMSIGQSKAGMDKRGQGNRLVQSETG